MVNDRGNDFTDVFQDRLLGAFGPEDKERAWRAYRVANVVWDAARVMDPKLGPFAEDPDLCWRAVIGIDHYARTRQWVPFVESSSIQTHADKQRTLADLADALLLYAPKTLPGNDASPPASPPALPKGWAGRAQPAHSEIEVAIAAQMGCAAWDAFSSNQPWKSVSAAQSRHAEQVLTLAKVHGIDAVRLAFMEYGIDPRFAGPIVADVCYGGPTRQT